MRSGRGAARERVLEQAEHLFSERGYAAALGMMVRSNLPAIAQTHADRLLAISHETLFAPLAGALRRAEEPGDIRAHNPILLAATFISLIEGLWDAYGGRTSAQQREDLTTELIDVLLEGLRPREPEGVTR